MSLLKKSLLIATILVAYIAIAVFATNVNTGNNICKISKKTLFNGTQNPNGECVTTVMGELPSKNQMTSSLFVFPQNNQVIKANTNFTVKLAVTGLTTGFFDDPATQYYIFPQALDNNGVIQGHSHVTIQKLTGNNNQPLDPQVFAFFKGLNDPAQGGILSTPVDNGLPAGQYRICSMAGAFAHQPVLMPIAQRGAQDDCVRFTAK